MLDLPRGLSVRSHLYRPSYLKSLKIYSCWHPSFELSNENFCVLWFILSSLTLNVYKSYINMFNHKSSTYDLIWITDFKQFFCSCIFKYNFQWKMYSTYTEYIQRNNKKKVFKRIIHFENFLSLLTWNGIAVWELRFYVMMIIVHLLYFVLLLKENNLFCSVIKTWSW